jgi:hypothetical protein
LQVDVHVRDDFDRLLDDLDELDVEELVIDIVADADALSAPAEFAELARRARSGSLRISIATDDPIRRELALIYGLEAADASNATTRLLFSVASDQTTVVRRRSVDDAESLPADPPPNLPRRDDHLLAPRGGPVYDSDASYSFVVAPPVQQTFAKGETAEYVTRRPAKPAGTRPRARRAADLSAIVTATLVIVVAVTVLLVGLLAPSATIVLVPETRPVTVELTYGVGTVGLPLDVTIEPSTISRTLVYEASTAATGERMEPDEAARGMVFVTNPHSESVLLPAGTIFTSADGIQTFSALEDIEIPAADPFGAATFGTAVVDVIADAAGMAGNLPIGALSGELPSGVLYQNRFQLDGGSERVVKVVTEADQARLTRQAEAGLEAQIATALDDELDSEWRLLDAAKPSSDVTVVFDAQPGDEADDVTIRAALPVEGSAYDPAALEAAARRMLDGRMRALTPDGFRIVADSMAVSTPRRIETASGVAYEVTSSATVEAVLPDDLQSTLASELEGKSEGSARRIIDGIKGLAGYHVAYGPGWLPWEPVPRFSNRISVAIDGAQVAP